MFDKKENLINIFIDTEKAYNTKSALKKSIENTKEHTRLYLADNIPDISSANAGANAKVTVSKKRSFEAAFDLKERYPDSKIAVHNFASATNPGGGVKRGSSAQEECLCRCSTLYPCLDTKYLLDNFYGFHRKLHDLRYTDACIYSPDVIVFKDDSALSKDVTLPTFVKTAQFVLGYNADGTVVSLDLSGKTINTSGIIRLESMTPYAKIPLEGGLRAKDLVVENGIWDLKIISNLTNLEVLTNAQLILNEYVQSSKGKVSLEEGAILYVNENSSLYNVSLNGAATIYKAPEAQFSINGKFTDRQKEVYNAVLRVNEEIINSIKPGVKYKDINDKATDLIAEECIKLGLIDDKKDVRKYYYHSIGHSLGMDTHDIETPHRDITFEPGVVFTVEPGIYIEEEGIGIRIEDDILVTKDGIDNLSKDIIKTVEDIDNYF